MTITAIATPIRVQLRRAAGWRLPENAAVVSRQSPFGNPFVAADTIAQGQAGNALQARAVVVRLHRQWLDGYGPDEITTGRHTYSRSWVWDNLPTLAGRSLACWCPVEEPDVCHAATLLRLANR